LELPNKTTSRIKKPKNFFKASSLLTPSSSESGQNKHNKFLAFKQTLSPAGLKKKLSQAFSLKPESRREEGG
jgi:hypothetical protein